MRTMRSVLLCAALTAVGTAAKAADELDRSFGVQGFVTLGFDPGGPGARDGDDDGVLACAHPGGGLVATGVASNGRRIVTVWLDEDGELDPDFSGDGKESFPIAGGFGEAAVGLCLPNGRLLLAYRLRKTDGDSDLRVVRILPDTGMPDAGFDIDGTAAIDLDVLASGLGYEETPLGLNLDAADAVLVSGSYSILDPERPAGFVLRLTATGALGASHLSGGESLPISSYVGAVPAGNGKIPAILGGLAGYRELRADTLAPILNFTNSLGGQAMRVAPFGTQHLLIAGVSFDASHGRVTLMDLVTFERDELEFAPLDGGDRLARAQAAATSDGGIQFAAEITDFVSGIPVGTYFARLTRDASGTLALDPDFGDGGRYIVRRPSGAGCTTTRRSSFARFTYWRGRPTAIGQVASACSDDSDREYQLLRLKPPALFRDGFEGRTPALMR